MDDWISRVYGSRRTRQGASVSVVHHTGAHGQRYQVESTRTMVMMVMMHFY
jgi:hypothetical protein